MSRSKAGTAGLHRHWTLGESLEAKIYVAFVVLASCGLLALSGAGFVPSMRGSDRRAAPGVRGEGRIEVRHGSVGAPELHLELAKGDRGGGEEVVATMSLPPARQVAPENARGPDVVSVYYYRVSFDLMKLVYRGPTLSQRLGRRLVGKLPIRYLWHPDRYRLHVVSPQPIECTPPYYLASELDSLDKDFVVTVQ